MAADLVLPASGRDLSVAEVEGWCDQIAQIVSEEADIHHLTDLRSRFQPFAAAFTKATKKGSSTIAATERRIEVRLGELLTQSRESGELVKHGGDRKTEIKADAAALKLADVGLTRQEAAEFVAMAEHPEVVEQVIAESSDTAPASRNRVRQAVKAERRKQSAEHPAKFSVVIMDAIVESLAAASVTRILDPFAGTGLVHAIADRLHVDSVGVEIEPEWAAMHPRTVCADSRTLTHDLVGQFDAVITSPTYGNRMADHHDARDLSDRGTYKHRLGRELTDGNSGAMYWGDEYRNLHTDVYRRCVELLAPLGTFVVNVKDHVKDGRRVPVSAWHLSTLLGLGLTFVDDASVPSKGLGGSVGDNSLDRLGVEHIYVFTKKETP